ncbi:phosphate butyryltransferase [Neobacillus notoginsengisoli]|uniref:Phosphate butyryltransferase n=1 Tax=Neobacillus notoginsengisoli TaxID=1578198 RepID=A0A417YVW0_9BACI|nr:phosphate acyltransferase [Neobacillus notoginsengisoli]RHW41464.1 phosphate butyryltransferase [Neobacillus notoginsengisoli]
MRYGSFSEVIEEAKRRRPIRMSVAAAQDLAVLEAIKDAVELGIIEPVLVGDHNQISQLASLMGFPLNKFEVIPASTDEEAAFKAAEIASDGRTQAIMKGLVNSTPFLKGVLHRQLSLRTGRIFSHLSAFEIPGTESLLFMTDGGINISPDFGQKKQIVLNALEFLKQIGMDSPRTAILAANELVMESMPVTCEASLLVAEIKVKMDIPIEGPLPLDLAISKDSLLHKGIDSELDGKADLLIVPTIEAGNIFGKAITYYAHGTMAGIVLGAKVPLVLNSRSDSAKAKLASIALAVVAASNAAIPV